jgi:hypothetical protein
MAYAVEESSISIKISFVFIDSLLPAKTILTAANLWRIGRIEIIDAKPAAVLSIEVGS